MSDQRECGEVQRLAEACEVMANDWLKPYGVWTGDAREKLREAAARLRQQAAELARMKETR